MDEREGRRPGFEPGRAGPPLDAQRQAGGREVVAVAVAAVAVVLGAAVVTSAVPPLHALVLRTPVAIGVLVVGTGVVLWRLARGG